GTTRYEFADIARYEWYWATHAFAPGDPPACPPDFLWAISIGRGVVHWPRPSGWRSAARTGRFRVRSMMSCPSREIQGGRHEVRTVRRRLPQMNHEVSAYP